MNLSTEYQTQGGASAEVAYEAIAPVYDDFTDNHDYDLWLGALMPKVEEHGLRGDRLLDVACGTGKSFLPMLAKGWKVTACDVSARMVDVAQTKVGPDVSLSVQDMRELPVMGSFDLVFCIDDPINYMLSQEELESALTHIGANLAPDGLLLFDANTIQAYRTFFAEHAEVERGDRRMIWDGRTDPEAPPRTIAEAEFRVESIADGGDLIPPELHRQRHFPAEDVHAAIAAAGLECLDVWGHSHEVVLEQPVEETRHTKSVYIARRRG